MERTVCDRSDFICPSCFIKLPLCRFGETITLAKSKKRTYRSYSPDSSSRLFICERIDGALGREGDDVEDVVDILDQ